MSSTSYFFHVGVAHQGIITSHLLMSSDQRGTRIHFMSLGYRAGLSAFESLRLRTLGLFPLDFVAATP
jgi:hypothetical protein